MDQAVFPGVPCSRRGHFQLCFYAAVLRLVGFLQRLGDAQGEAPDECLARYPFLKHYAEELRRYMPAQTRQADASAWWNTTVANWEQQATEALPLMELMGLPGVDAAVRLALMLVGLVEEDSRFGAIFADLQAPSGQRRPTLETLARVVEVGDFWALTQPLIDCGAVEITCRDVPRPEWTPAVPAELWEVVRGLPLPRRISGFTWHAPAELPLVSDLLLPPEVAAQVSQLPALVAAGQVRTLVVRGMNGSGRFEAIGSVARAIGRGLLVGTADTPCDRLGPLCILTGAMPVLRYEPGPGETVTLPALTGYGGPLGVTLGAAGGLADTSAAQALTITLPAPDRATRLRSWQVALQGRATPDLEPIVDRYQMPPGYILRAGALAVNRAGLAQRGEVAATDVQEACRALNRQVLETLAVRLDVAGSWSDLVVSPATGERLRELESRCLYRDAARSWLRPAYESGGGRGVRALLCGPSGTGKTLAARTLAAMLGIDLYRVDLAAVVNKYIGETEKNLNRVLSRAEELDVILLLDEGDSLLARRSDVKSANDRYANLETNYLLQRLESYQGIILITTNAAEFIDRAFQRRMDVVVSFSPPQAAERHAIWSLHLPAGHMVEPAFLGEVALRCAMNGGQIRNAALHAALFALAEGEPVAEAHLRAAILSEYRKAGALCPLVEAADAPDDPTVNDFLDRIKGQ